jgi:hypothetical protein
MFAAFAAAISPPTSVQQDSQGMLKGTGGGTTSFQLGAGMIFWRPLLYDASLFASF